MNATKIKKYQAIRQMLIEENVIKETNLIYSDFFSAKYNANIYLKPENLQNSGSYKIRGSYNKISKLVKTQKLSLLVTASAGNHAQGLSYAAKKFNLSATIFMPTITPALKIEATKRLGANVIVEGENFDQSLQAAKNYCNENNGIFIHPFDDYDVIDGQGTVAVEIFEQLKNVDVVIVPIGGGGLISGMSEYLKLVNPKIKIIGVEPSNANCMQKAVEKNEIITLQKVGTIAEGVAVKQAGRKTFGFVKNYVDEIITVNDSELIEVFLDLLENHKLVAEGAGLISLAALKHLNLKNLNVVSVLSGGNMDVLTMSKLINRGLIIRDRSVLIRIELKDVPGELVNVSAIIAQVFANVIQIQFNPYASVNEFNLVYLTIKVECSGTEHKNKLLAELRKNGYNVEVISEIKGGK